MVHYAHQMSALANSNLFQIPHRQDIVLAMASAGLLCLALAAAMLIRAGETPLLVRVIED